MDEYMMSWPKSKPARVIANLLLVYAGCIYAYLGANSLVIFPRWIDLFESMLETLTFSDIKKGMSFALAVLLILCGLNGLYGVFQRNLFRYYLVRMVLFIAIASIFVVFFTMQCSTYFNSKSSLNFPAQPSLIEKFYNIACPIVFSYVCDTRSPSEALVQVIGTQFLFDSFPLEFNDTIGSNGYQSYCHSPVFSRTEKRIMEIQRANHTRKLHYLYLFNAGCQLCTERNFTVRVSPWMNTTNDIMPADINSTYLFGECASRLFMDNTSWKRNYCRTTISYGNGTIECTSTSEGDSFINSLRFHSEFSDPSDIVDRLLPVMLSSGLFSVAMIIYSIDSILDYVQMRRR